MLRKDIRSYSNRLSKRMAKIDNVRIKIDKYFQDSYQKCANLEFTEDALKAFRSVGGQPRGAATEIFHDIDKDIVSMDVFISRWEIYQNIDKKTIKLAKRLHHELVQLRNHIDDTPTDMMADVKNMIMQKKLGGY